MFDLFKGKLIPVLGGRARGSTCLFIVLVLYCLQQMAVLDLGSHEATDPCPRENNNTYYQIITIIIVQYNITSCNII